MTKQSFIIAIDGPAASGKGTLAKKIAQHYAIAYLDTGLSYRALAENIVKKNISLENKKKILELAYKLDLTNLDGEKLSTPELGQMASKIAVFPDIRHILVEKQRDFAQKNKQAVLDGRDIGTIVCPMADVKLFITADLEIRAKRRFKQAFVKDPNISYTKIRTDLAERDKRDSERSEGPLRQAKDAHLLDTSKMDIIDAFNKALAIIDQIWLRKPCLNI